MDVKEMMLYADQVVFEQTGNHLDDMQLGVIEGVLNRQRYGEIAKDLQCTEGYVKDVGYRLWTIFSDVFGEKIDKSNLKSALTRHGIINIENVNIFGSVSDNSSVASVNQCLHPSESKHHQLDKREMQLNTVKKLRAFGLQDEQIADCLDWDLSTIQQVQQE